MPATIYTIGHSVHTLERLGDLLVANQIDLVVDVRSYPVSGRHPHFNHAPMKEWLAGLEISAVYRGEEVGGRPRSRDFYDASGFVRYDLISQTRGYLATIDWLIKQSQNNRVALLCGEEDPTHCHRRRLIGRTLTQLGIELAHIRGGGHVQMEQLVPLFGGIGQVELFDTADNQNWRSSAAMATEY
ncbi:MAG: DUF488 domain-containing protein [Chthonomonadales bacterium]